MLMEKSVCFLSLSISAKPNVPMEYIMAPPINNNPPNIELSAEHNCNEDSKTIDANIINAPANDLHFISNNSFVN